MNFDFCAFKVLLCIVPKFAANIYRSNKYDLLSICIIDQLQNTLLSLLTPYPANHCPYRFIALIFAIDKIMQVPRILLYLYFLKIQLPKLVIDRVCQGSSEESDSLCRRIFTFLRVFVSIVVFEETVPLEQLEHKNLIYVSTDKIHHHLKLKTSRTTEFR